MELMKLVTAYHMARSNEMFVFKMTIISVINIIVDTVVGSDVTCKHQNVDLWAFELYDKTLSHE